MKQEDRAIVLKRIPYGDADRIVKLLGRKNGLISGIARFARKSKRRYAGAFEPGNIVDVEFVERKSSDLVRIDRADVAFQTTGVTKTLDRIEALSLALEIATGFIRPRLAVPEKFDLLENYIGYLCKNDPSKWDMILFELRWLKYSGFEPNLNSCTFCGKKISGGLWSFDFEQGGLLCNDCASAGEMRFNITDDLLRAFSGISEGHSFEKSAVLDRVDDILRGYIGHLLGKPLKSARGIFN